VSDPFDLRGRTALVTGAASGIGAATALRLARQGAAVLLTHYPDAPREVHDVTRAIAEGGGRAHAHAADVSRPEQVVELVEVCAKRLAAPDIVVASAGVVRRTPIGGASQDAFDEVMAVNLGGVHHVFEHTAPAMRERGWGRLVAISSITGHLYGWPDHAAYCAAKAAVVGLMRTYALEFAADGVTANAIVPGPVRSPQSLDPVNSLGEAGLAAVATRIPAGRVGEPDDIAGVAAFLAGDAAAYVNGQTLVVDGGHAVLGLG
jgi:3-oxoacyl-[acyl-carrier protein] reductase